MRGPGEKIRRFRVDLSYREQGTRKYCFQFRPPAAAIALTVASACSLGGINLRGLML